MVVYRVTRQMGVAIELEFFKHSRAMRTDGDVGQRKRLRDLRHGLSAGQTQEYLKLAGGQAGNAGCGALLDTGPKQGLNPLREKRRPTRHGLDGLDEFGHVRRFVYISTHAQANQGQGELLL